MIEVAYYLARFGEPRPGKPSVPPVELGTSSWKKAYATFFARLGDGRSAYAFSNTLKNARDLYDGHMSTGRVGWRENDQGRPPAKLPAKHKDVADAWQSKSRDELWKHVAEFADLTVAGLPVRMLDDVDTQQGEQDDRRCRTEGGRRVVISTRVERDPRLRDAAIRIHGTTCAACGFAFAEVYGDWGEGYIEVHHLEPLGDSESGRETNPESDLVVLCANCHRMAHRRRDIALSVEELRNKIDTDALREWAVRFVSA